MNVNNKKKMLNGLNEIITQYNLLISNNKGLFNKNMINEFKKKRRELVNKMNALRVEIRKNESVARLEKLLQHNK